MKGKAIGRVLDDVVEVDPDRAALIIAGVTTSFGQLAAATSQVAAGLRAAGVSPGWRVPVVDDASVLAVATLIGAADIGAATALMNPRLTGGELAVLMDAAGTASTGVAGSAYAAVAAEAGLDPVLGTTTLLTGPGLDPAERTEPSPTDDAVVLFTSGTTGTPKVVPLTHGALAPRVASFSPSVDPVAAVSIMCVPLVHVGGMLGVLVALARGSTSVVQTRFDAGEWLALVERHAVTTAFVVPTMLYRILEHPDFPTTDLSSLVSVTYGAAPATPELIRRAMASLPGVALTNTFGQTETMGSITALGPGDHPPERLASVGKPLPGVEIRIVHPTTGEEAPSGTVGELWVRSDVVVVPEAPMGEGAGDGTTPAGWFRTGDMVSADSEGYLYPAGRLSDTINRGGEKFAPAEVEDVVRAHPAVRDVAAFGVPDPEMGQRVGVAVVVSDPLDLQQLREFCQGRIANFKQPERLLVLTELPITDFGKVDRKDLRSRFAERWPRKDEAER
jgi:acyl-CoA synthetase (AMP-forming)/AMP-acid ligase II